MKHMRTSLVLAAIFVLSACGFKPMHAPNAFGGNSVNLRNITVQMQANEKIDFLLAQALRDRMGDNTGARYILKPISEVDRKNLGIGADDVASRYDLVLDTEFELVDARTGDVVYRNEVSATSTFAAPRDPYGTVTAQSNAQEQVAAETADRIIQKLAQYQAKTDTSATGK